MAGRSPLLCYLSVSATASLSVSQINNLGVGSLQENATNLVGIGLTWYWDILNMRGSLADIECGVNGTCPAWVADAERSSASSGRHPANDDECDDRRLAVGLYDAALVSVAMAAAAAAAAAMAALFCSELRVPRWNALRRSVDATIPAIVISRQTYT